MFDLRPVFTDIKTRTMYMYSILIGLLAGLGVALFNELLHMATQVTMGWARLAVQPGPRAERAPLGSAATRR